MTQPMPTVFFATKGTFSWALEYAKHTAHVAREAWNGTKWITYQSGYPDGVPVNTKTAEVLGVPEGTRCSFSPYLIMKHEDGTVAPWTPNHCDMFACDWYCISINKKVSDEPTHLMEGTFEWAVCELKKGKAVWRSKWGGKMDAVNLQNGTLIYTTSGYSVKPALTEEAIIAEDWCSEHVNVLKHSLDKDHDTEYCE